MHFPVLTCAWQVGEGVFLSPNTAGKGEVMSHQSQKNLNFLLVMAETLQNN